MNPIHSCFGHSSSERFSISCFQLKRAAIQWSYSTSLNDLTEHLSSSCFVNRRSLMYSVIMIAMIIAVAVGAGACPMNLTLVFLLFILSIHIIAGLGSEFYFEQQDHLVKTRRAVHFGLGPRKNRLKAHFDLMTLFCGIIYLLMIPSIFIFLPIYMYANLNDVSWGTRSGSQSKNTSDGFFSSLKNLRFSGLCDVWNYILYGPQVQKGSGQWFLDNEKCALSFLQFTEPWKTWNRKSKIQLATKQIFRTQIWPIVVMRIWPI